MREARWKEEYAGKFSILAASPQSILTSVGAAQRARLCLLRTVVATKVKKDEHLLQAE